MAFDWSEYLMVAQSLSQGTVCNSVEAARRSAVSRAYYAAYGHARRYATRRLTFTPSRSADDHWRLCEYLAEKRYEDLANDLEELRRWRNQCDYDDTVGALEGLVSASLKGARNIIKILS